MPPLIDFSGLQERQSPYNPALDIVRATVLFVVPVAAVCVLAFAVPSFGDNAFIIVMAAITYGAFGLYLYTSLRRRSRTLRTQRDDLRKFMAANGWSLSVGGPFEEADAGLIPPVDGPARATAHFYWRIDGSVGGRPFAMYALSIYDRLGPGSQTRLGFLTVIRTAKDSTVVSPDQQTVFTVADKRYTYIFANYNAMRRSEFTTLFEASGLLKIEE